MFLIMGKFFPIVVHYYGKVGTIVAIAGMAWVELVNRTIYGI